jgi:hypothetical protein
MTRWRRPRRGLQCAADGEGDVVRVWNTYTVNAEPWPRRKDPLHLYYSFTLAFVLACVA